MAVGPDRKYMSASQAADTQVDEGLRNYMLGVYNHMGLGLALSGVVALAIATVPALASIFVFSPLRLVFVLAPLGVLLLMSFRAHKMSPGTIKALYYTVCGLLGISMSALLFVYSPTSVIKTFFITAAAFGALSLYGYTTKKSLSGLGTFCMMGLIGLVIAMVVNIFVASSMMDFIIGAAGVLIFSGLTAYDTQNIKNQYYEGMDSHTHQVSSIFGALALYLNFVNLFQFLLMFLGDRD